MKNTEGTNIGSGSTRWERKLVRISRAPHGRENGLPKAARWHHLPWRNPRQWQTIRVKYVGGPSATWEVDARGSRGYVDGFDAIHDVMAEICQWSRKPPTGALKGPRECDQAHLGSCDDRGCT